MAANKEDKERKKIAVDATTYEILKTFARFNGLKLSAILRTLADIVSENEVLREQIVDLTLQKQAEDANLDFN